MSPNRPHHLALLAIALLLGGCDTSPPAEPTGTPRALQLDAASLGELALQGVTISARPGDYVLRNEAATFVVQGPTRDLAIGPYGGSVVDVGVRGGNDLLGEVIPILALGRTIKAESVAVVEDGREGDAVVEVRGIDATNVYLNIEALAPGLIAYQPDGSGILAHDPESPLNLGVTITYRLPQNDPVLSIEYTFENRGKGLAAVPLGFLLDTRAAVESFSLSTGFNVSVAKSFEPAELLALLALEDTTPMMVVFDHTGAVAVVPRRVDDKSPPRVIGFNIPSVGAGLVLEANSALGAASDPTVVMDPGETAQVVLDLVVAPTPAEALALGWRRLGESLAPIEGCVTEGGEPAVGVRVGFEESTRGPTTVFITDETGCFAGEIPPGSYTAVAGLPLRPPSEVVSVKVSPNSAEPARVDLTIPPLGTLRVSVGVYNDINSPKPSIHPCRITLVGESTLLEHPLLGLTPEDGPNAPISRQWISRTCSGTFSVNPGRYLAFVTRGPEFTRIEQIVHIAAGATASLQGALHRVVDSAGYAASDFHVHSVYSSDSRVPARERALSVAAEAMDFWVSLEHDVVADYTDQVAALGLSQELLTAPGAEVTTFDLGHFGAYPLAVDESSANGGTPDWATRDDGTRPTFDELFDEIHARGALVQVNHPRSPSGIALGNYFTRAGLRFHPDTMQALADPDLQPVPNELLRYPTGLQFFSANFDIIEVINGASTRVENGQVIERDLYRGGEDWMSFLSAGRRIVGVANSDTHDLRKPPGTPRTMVGGHSGGVTGIMTALAKGDAIMTTGPHLLARLIDASGESASVGELLSPTSNTVTVRVHVETPDWYRVNAVDVLGNVFVPTPPSDGPLPTIISPTQIVPQQVVRPNGGVAWVAEIDLLLDLTELPRSNGDSWVVVRVGGTQSNLFPVVTSGGGTLNLEATTPETFLTGRHGTHPHALTNPIFIDMDGDGLWNGQEI